MRNQKVLTVFPRWVKGQAQGWEPGGFKLWVNSWIQPVHRPTEAPVGARHDSVDEGIELVRGVHRAEVTKGVKRYKSHLKGKL
jgi:hypothetical protein